MLLPAKMDCFETESHYERLSFESISYPPVTKNVDHAIKIPKETCTKKYDSVKKRKVMKVTLNSLLKKCTQRIPSGYCYEGFMERCLCLRQIHDGILQSLSLKIIVTTIIHKVLTEHGQIIPAKELASYCTITAPTARRSIQISQGLKDPM